MKYKLWTLILVWVLAATMVASPVLASAIALDESETGITNPTGETLQDTTGDTGFTEDPTGLTTDATEEPDWTTDASDPSADPTETTTDATDPSEDPSEPTGNPSDPTEDPSEPTGNPSEPTGNPSDPTEDPSDPTGETTDPSEEPELPFSCMTYDKEGRELQGYWSEKDGLWYLFITSTQKADQTELHFTGPITQASSGVLDENAGVLSGAFQTSGDRVDLTEKDGTVHTVVILQSTLPSVYVDLENTTLEAIHADKDRKHKGNSLYIMDPEGAWDLSVPETVEIKGRGNSTWREYEKKAYQIKFDSKTSVLGMGKAKKWVLLANSSDDSMMRTQLVSRMAQNMGMAFVASFEYVDLWIEGEYLGTYLMGEKVEPGSSRLNLTHDAGALFEHDEDFYLDEDYWFVSKVLGRHFTMKEIVTEEEEVIQAAIADFEAAVDRLALYLYSTPSEDVTLEELGQIIDVDSFICYYLVNEYTLNRESFSTSFYWYKDGPEDVIHLGPIWDFDTCMGNDGEPNTSSYGENHVLFRNLLAAPAFYERTLELFEVYRENLASMTGSLDVIRQQIAASAHMNYCRWDVLGKPNPKGGTDFYPTFDEAADALKEWLRGREAGFRVVAEPVATSTVSEDCMEMEMRFRDGGEYDKVMFALWSLKNGTDDIRWYRGEQASDGAWYATADLGNHQSEGLYNFYVYTDDQQTLLGTGRNYVPEARSPRYVLEAVLDEEAMTLTVYFTDNTQLLTKVRFAIWGMSNQADTLKRIEAVRDLEGYWAVTVPLCIFNLEKPDSLVIHAYGAEAGKEEYLNEEKVFLSNVPEHDIPEGESTCSICGYDPQAGTAIATTPMYRLYNPNSGEHFYTGSEEERDTLVGYGWHYEGIAWHAPISEGAPVYRVYNPNSGDHHYTMSQEEVDNLVALGWQYEGVAWNSAPEGSPQYRLYNPNADLGSHHYTSSLEERDYLVSLGWILEGIGWYGVISQG